MDITPNQLRSARAFIDISRNDVSDQTGIGVQTLADLENGKTSSPRTSTLEILKLFYETRGLEFTEDGGVRPRTMRFKHLKGTDGFRELMNDVYEQSKEVGGKIRLWNARPSNWTKWLGQEWYAQHTQRMQKLLDKISFWVTCEEGDTNFIGGKHSEYRWVPKKIFNEQSIYCFGDRIAFMNFEEDSVNIYVLYSRDFSDSFKLLFDFVWDEITTIPSIDGYKPEGV